MATFYAASQAHAERAGAVVVDDMATAIAATDGGFHVETQAGAYTADRVVTASTYDVSYLEDVLGEHFLSEGGETWLDSDLAGVESQIAVAVGHGARVGVALIEEYRRVEEDIWAGSVSYADWVVQQGRYAGEEWLETATGWHLDAAPEDLDDEVARERARELAREQQAQQIDEAEVARRTERAHRRLLEHLDDDVIREYARDLGDDR